jgi:hypothetical protein
MHVWVQVERNLAHKKNFIVSFLVNVCRNYTRCVLRHLVLQLYVHCQTAQVAGCRTSVGSLLLQATSVQGQVAVFEVGVFHATSITVQPCCALCVFSTRKNALCCRDITAGKCYPI